MKKVEAESLGAVYIHTIHLENKRINSEESCKKPTDELAIRNKEGITLIALVITIIVLLILAGVSIAMLTGTNGILTQAQLAKSETEKAAARESLEIKMLGAKTENSTESIEDSLSKMDNVEIMSKTKDGVSVKCNGYQFFIDNDKNVSEIKNLVTNGFLEKNNNTNFTGLNYKNGFLTAIMSERKTGTSSELIKVNTNKKYFQSVTMKSNNQNSRSYVGLIQYDIGGNIIGPNHYLFKTGSTTYLIQDLNNGDTEIHLNDVSGFSYDIADSQNYLYNGIIVWNYKDSTGYQYPEETYSRNVYESIIEKDNIDKVNNVIKLKTPWSNGKIEKGTKLSQARSGRTYNYGILENDSIDGNWKTYTNIITGEGNETTQQFRPGTRYVKLLWLMNWETRTNVTIDIKDIIFSEIN